MRVLWSFPFIAALPLGFVHLLPSLPPGVRDAFISWSPFIRPFGLARFLDPDIRARLAAADSGAGQLAVAYLDWMGVFLVVVIGLGLAAVVFCAVRYRDRWADRPNARRALIVALPAAALGAPLFLGHMLYTTPSLNPGWTQFMATWILLMALFGLFGAAMTLWSGLFRWFFSITDGRR